MRLGAHFTLRELTVSSKASALGLDNAPPPEAVRRLGLLVERVLDPLRSALGRPVRVTSGYRSPAVNAAIGGSRTSQHMTGEAADIKVEGVSAPDLAAAIVRLGLPVDQVIWYAPERGGHVHVSHRADGRQRGEVLEAPVGGGYVAWGG